MGRARIPGLLLVLALVASACASGAGPDGVTVGEGGLIEVEQIPPSPHEDVPSALADLRDAALPTPAVDPDMILFVLTPDGIPAIDEPRFERASQVDWLEDREPVVVLELEGESRAYPARIMTWHEIANDTFGDIPVALTYCPLCNSALAFDRRLGDRVLDFGVSGMLFNSALVMYDRQTESLWSHFIGEALAGFLTGEQLESFPVATISWGDFKKRHPDGLVLSMETGFSRNYGINPYDGYDTPTGDIPLFRGAPDDRFPPKTRVVGIFRDGKAVALLLDVLLNRGVIHPEIGDDRLVIWAKPGTASALDTVDIPSGKDVGATGVFIPEMEGIDLTFEVTQTGFRDSQTGTEWDVLGNAVRGRFAGARLEAVEHIDTFWFAWTAFYPQTEILEP